MSYKISYNSAKNTVEVQLKTLMDKAYLVTPKPYAENGIEKGAARFSVRCLLKADLCKKFAEELAEATSKLCNGTTQVHPNFVKPTTKPQYIARYFFKNGADVIAEKKELDLAEKGEKKNYRPSMDYLQDLCYFYAKSQEKYQPKVYDKFGKVMQISSDDFFTPSFIGVVRLNIKHIALVNVITAYINGIQYLAPSEIDYTSSFESFEETDADDNMFGEVAKKSDFEKDLGFSKKIEIGTPKTPVVFVSGKKTQLDSYLDEFA